MEVVMPTSPSRDFYFPSNSVYTSAPASPKPFGNPSEHYYFLSAPASPRGSSFKWEEKSETGADALDFAFEFSGEGEGEVPVAADELFEGGKIRPLNFPLRQSSMKRGDGCELGKETNADAIDRKMNMIENSSETASTGERGRGRGRGRGRSATSATSEGYSRSRRAVRSLSPLRGGGGGELENSQNTASPSSASLVRGSGSKKWSTLKDLFLFRSASDGRAIGRGSKDPLRKYTILFPSSSSNSSSSTWTSPSKTKKKGETGAITTSSKSGKGSMAYAHETHYTANRAASEEMKKKTPLPFHRNSLFGYLRFNPAINSIGRRLNSYSTLYRSRS